MSRSNSAKDREQTDESSAARRRQVERLVAATESGRDQVAAAESALGWERLKTLVTEAEAAVAKARPRHLT
jgi:hypothetical protein